MQVQRFRDPVAFNERVQPFLLQAPAEYNLLLGVVNRLAERGEVREDVYLAIVEDAGDILAVAMRTPPFNLVVSDVSVESAKALAYDVHDFYGTDLRGVSGTEENCGKFIQHWHTLTHIPGELEMPQRIYQLTRVIPVAGVSGTIRPIQETDRAIVKRWSQAFASEAMGDAINDEEADESFNIRLEASPPTLFIWEDEGVPVSMTGTTRPIPGGISVGPVYTPPERRKRGYASALVAAVSQMCLNNGYQRCFLYTDLRNPTSNHIYQNIGYEAVVDVAMYRFAQS